MKHKMIKVRDSGILYEGKFVEIEIWKCDKCEKIMIINAEKSTRLFLDGKLGEEIE